MDTKPSYLGLLNAIAVGERNGAELFNCWSATTTNDEVRAVLHTVALREAEHALAFEKRIDELGYGLICKEEPGHADRMCVAASTTMSDRQKVEQLKLLRSKDNPRDVFDSMFENKDLDPQTGGLLGRYIAEERNTGRLLAGCYGALCEAEGGHADALAFTASATGKSSEQSSGPTLDDLAQQVNEAGRHLADLVRSIGSALTAR